MIILDSSFLLATIKQRRKEEYQRDKKSDPREECKFYKRKCPRITDDKKTC